MSDRVTLYAPTPNAQVRTRAGAYYTADETGVGTAAPWDVAELQSQGWTTDRPTVTPDPAPETATTPQADATAPPAPSKAKAAADGAATS